MWPVSEQYQKMILNNARALGLSLLIGAGHEIYDLDPIDIEGSTLSVTYTAMNKGFELGAVVAADCKISLDNRDGRWNDVELEGATIIPLAGLILADGSTEFVPLGVFIVDNPGIMYSVINLEAVDEMVLLDRPLVDVAISWPATQYEALQAIAQHCDIILDDSILALPMVGTMLEGPDENSKLTCRDAVGEIALINAGFARMSRLGNLEIIPIQKPDKETAYILPFGTRSSFKQTTETLTITGLVYGEELVFGDEEYTLDIAPLELPSEDALGSILSHVWDAVGGLSYVAYEAAYYGNPALETGDGILHEIKDGKEVLSFITKHVYKHGGSCQLKAEGVSKVAASQKNQTARQISKITYRAVKERIEELGGEGGGFGIDGANIKNMIQSADGKLKIKLKDGETAIELASTDGSFKLVMGPDNLLAGYSGSTKVFDLIVTSTGGELRNGNHAIGVDSGGPYQVKSGTKTYF